MKKHYKQASKAPSPDEDKNADKVSIPEFKSKGGVMNGKYLVKDEPWWDEEIQITCPIQLCTATKPARSYLMGHIASIQKMKLLCTISEKQASNHRDIASDIKKLIETNAGDRGPWTKRMVREEAQSRLTN